MARRRARRWLLWSCVVVLGLLITALLSSPIWLRPIAQRQASAMLARPVTIGRLHLRPGNPLVVTAEDVVIGNPKGFPPEEEPFARVPRLGVWMDALASLRRRQVVIMAIVLERPVLRAVATTDGRDNFGADLFAAAEGRPVDLPVPALRILDGRARVSIADLRADFEVAFTIEHGVAEDSPQSIVAEAKGTDAGQPIAARFTGEAPRDQSRPWAIELHVESGLTRATANGAVENPLSKPSASISLLLAGPDVALLGPLTGVSFPTTPPYELTGKLNYTSGLYRLIDVAGRMGRSDLEGTMAVATRSGRRPEITAELRSRTVDLRDIASLLGGEPGTPGTPEQHAQATRMEADARASPRILPQDRLNLPEPGRADLHLAYRAEHIQGRSMPLDSIEFRADVVDGAVTLHPLSFGVGGGRISGEVSLTPQTEGAVGAQAEIRFERLDLSRLMRASGGYQGAGALNGTAHIKGTGRSVAQILGDGDGSASLWMAGGDMSKLLVDLGGLRLGSALLSSLGGTPRTRVDCFVADFGLRRGVLSTRALLLDTADAVTEGDGALDLGRERVELRLRTKSKRLTIGVLPATLLVSGTFKEPHAALDPTASTARGGLAGALSALPTIQFGIGDDPRCEGVLGRLRGGQVNGSSGRGEGGGAGSSSPR